MLREKTAQDTVFLEIKHSTICIVSKEAREGWQEKQTTNPKTGEQVTKWIKPFESVSGYATKLEWYDRTDEKSGTRFVGYKLHLADDDERYILDLAFPHAGYNAFVKFAENIDWTKPVEFAAWHNRKDDKTAFCARQDGQAIKYRYTVANPGDCPPPIQRKGIGDKVKWDFADQEVWLKNRVDTVVVPAIEAAAKARAAQPAAMSAHAAAFHAQAPQQGPPDDEPRFDDSPPEWLEEEADRVPF